MSEIQWGLFRGADIPGAMMQGYERGRQIRQDRAMLQAGNALAGGDYKAGANALYGGGMIEQGSGLEDRGNALATRQAEVAAKQRTIDDQSILQGATAIRQLPPAQRRMAYEQIVKPRLAQEIGDTPEGRRMLEMFDQSDWQDGSIDTFIATFGGEVEKRKVQVFQSGGQAVGLDTQTGEQQWKTQIGEPEAPKSQVVEGPDGLYERQADGSWKQVAKFGAAPKVFAPRAPRGGGGRGGVGGTNYGSDPSGPQW